MHDTENRRFVGLGLDREPWTRDLHCLFLRIRVEPGDEEEIENETWAWLLADYRRGDDVGHANGSAG